MNYKTDKAEQEKQIQDFLHDWRGPSVDFVVATSGSTGTPKTISIPKHKALISAQQTLDYLKINPTDVFGIALNLSTIGGKMMIIRSTINENPLVALPVSANPLLEHDGRIDFIALSPVQLHTLLTESPQKLKEIRNILVGGGQISVSTVDLLKQHQITVYQSFGMTETLSHFALRKVGYHEETYFTVLPLFAVYALDEQLVVTSDELGINKLTTNDRIQMHGKHQFKWLGRMDFVINSGGVKLQLEEIEEKLRPLVPRVFFCWGLPDEKWGQKLVLVTTDREFSATKHDFEKYVHGYEVPKSIILVNQFIYSSSEKILRAKTLDSQSHVEKPIL